MEQFVFSINSALHRVSQLNRRERKKRVGKIARKEKRVYSNLAKKRFSDK
jgi:hypothetical protein